MADFLANPSTHLQTQESLQQNEKSISHHQESLSKDQPDQQFYIENISGKTEPGQTTEIILIEKTEKKELIVEIVKQSQVQPLQETSHNSQALRRSQDPLRKSQDPREVAQDLSGLHAKVDKILGKYKTSNIPIGPSSVDNLLRNSSYLNNLNKGPGGESPMLRSESPILRNSNHNINRNIQERAKSRGHASPTRSPTKSVRFADDYNFIKQSMYQSQISNNNLSISPVRNRENKEERPLKFSGYSSTVNTQSNVDYKTLYDQNKLDEIINRITGTPARIDHNVQSTKTLEPSLHKESPLFDKYHNQYVHTESRFEMENLGSHGSLQGQHQKMASLVGSIDNLALKLGGGENVKIIEEKEEQGEKSPEQLYAEHAARFFEPEESLKDFDFRKYKRI